MTTKNQCCNKCYSTYTTDHWPAQQTLDACINPNCKCHQSDSVVEKFAAIEHERWSKWQAYLHSKCVEHSDGKGEWVCFPAELYKRWERQINTPYVELSEAEKESDREQVRPYLEHLTTLQQTAQQEKEELIREAIRLSDHEESRYPTEFNEWRAFKGFRNGLRYWAKARGISVSDK